MKTEKTHTTPLQWVLILPAAFFMTVFLLASRESPVTSAAEMLEAMNGARIEALCCILLSAFLLQQAFRIRDRRERRYALAAGAVFALLNLVGFNIYHWDSLTRPGAGIFSLTLDLSWFLGSFLVFSAVLLILFHLALTHPMKPADGFRCSPWFGSNLRSFFVYFGLLMAVNVCFQIFFFPGILTWDSSVQIREGLGILPLSDQHPIVLTMIMKYIIALGRWLFGSLNGGIALYTCVQSILAALAMSWVLVYMAKRGIRPGFRIAALVYYGIHPAIACYSVTLWKDIWLSYFLLLYVVILIEIVRAPQSFFRKKSNLVLMSLVILGFLFSKNTGIAFLLVTMPFLLLCFRKYWKQTGTVMLVCLFLFGLVRLVILPACGILGGNLSDPLSVPIQQMTRTYLYEGDSMTEEEIRTLSELLPCDRLEELYQPGLSDDVKREFDTETFLEDVPGYTAFWLKLGAAHPRAYAESFLANSCGYWYPDVIYWQVSPGASFSDPETGEPGLQENQIARRHYFVHLYEMLQTVPGISTLMSTAFYFWAGFVLILICCLRRDRRMLIPFLVPIVTWILCILSPVISEFRYAFPTVVALPLLTAFTLQKDLLLPPEKSQNP